MDSNWQVIETPHFILNVRPGSFAEQNAARLGEVLEDQYAFVMSALDIRYAGRISLFLYASAADAGENNERSGTAYPETGAVRATVTPPSDNLGLLSHESNHVIEHNALGPPAASFMNEGLASAIMSERFHPGGKSFLYPWTARNAAQIPDLSSLVDDGTWGEQLTGATTRARRFSLTSSIRAGRRDSSSCSACDRRSSKRAFSRSTAARSTRPSAIGARSARPTARRQPPVAHCRNRRRTARRG